MITPEMQAKAAATRLEKAYNKQCLLDGRVTTLRAMIASIMPTRLTATVRTHEATRRGWEYKKLAAPVTEHTVWWMEDERELGWDIPKIVYDDLTERLSRQTLDDAGR